MELETKSILTEAEQHKELHHDYIAELARYLERNFPDYTREQGEMAKESEEVKRRERFYEDQTYEILENFGVNTSGIEKVGENLYLLKVKEHFWDQRLPEEYAYKGGAARVLLLRSLGLNSRVEPRDVDLVRVAGDDSRQAGDKEVAARFMPEDYEHGHGVEVIDLETYFRTRDFTVNEVLATDEKIWVSKECLLDTARHIIRLTEYEKDLFNGAGPKMLSKAIRLYAEAIHEYGEAYVEGIEGWEFEKEFINPFWLALQMDRAFERGWAVAEEYTRQLRLTGQIPEDIVDAGKAANYLLGLLGNDSFYYRHVPAEQYDLEDKWLEIEQEMEVLPSFRGHGKSRGDK